LAGGSSVTAQASATPAPRTLEDPLAEALRIVDLANARGLQVRLMGGMAVRAHAPAWIHRTRRVEVDLDFATRGKDRPAFFKLLEAEGYTADKRHNAMFGGAQGYFVDVPRRRPVDVVVDRLQMCHKMEFADRLPASTPTLPLAELLLSKLQVVKINRKDILDALALLSEVPLAGDDVGGRAISLGRIMDLTSNDWGWWRTVTMNLDRLAAFLASDLKADELDFGRETRFDPGAQVAELRAAIDKAPKSTKWKLRDRVGDRMSWYEEPEEVGHSR
jgi:hypothetical protein